MENGIEKPNVKVTLASKISAEDCAQLNLGYVDPSKINSDEWKNKESSSILFVARAGETLYRVKQEQDKLAEFRRKNKKTSSM